jgi:hypothetical protein
MAVLKNGILGKTIGSLDGITGYIIGRQNVIRNKAIDIAYTPSPASEMLRLNFAYALEIFNILKPLLVLTLKDKNPKRSILSEFLKLNLNKSIKNCSLDFDKLIIAKFNDDSFFITFTPSENENNIIHITFD